MKGPPVEGGALLVSEGRVLAVGTAADLGRQAPEAAREDHPGHALVPGLVNAHAHLELSSLGSPPTAGDFIGWILEVVRRKRACDLEELGRGIARGAAECHRLGQAAVADVLSAADGEKHYPKEGPRVLVFPEVIAPHAAQAIHCLERALAVCPAGAARLAGLSPHSPYTVGAEAYAACARAASERGLRLMTHLAESADEMVFCRGERGGVTDRLYPALGLDPPVPPGAHPVDWLDRLGLLGPGTLLVHGVHLGPAHVDLVGRRGAGVVLCPRSNRYLGVGRAPGRALLQAGVTVGLGTDSLLSAGDLDLWKDAAAAVEDYGWSPEEALRAATLGGAALLGAGGATGSFAPGSRADILAVPLGSGHGPWEQVLTAARGRWVG